MLLQQARTIIVSAATACCLLAGPCADPACAVTPPNAEAQAQLRKAFTSAAQGFDQQADLLLSQSISEWLKTNQPPDETAALYKTRGTIRQRQGELDKALADYSESLRLIELPDSHPDPAELQRTYVLRARVQEALQRWRPAESDLSAAIARLDDLDAIEATNPYLFSSRSYARSRLGDFSGAAEDAERAELDFKTIGDKVRRLTSSADLALALYGTDEVPAAVEKMRFVFKNKGNPVSNNPDDIALLQELSRKDAELHLAYAAHLYADAGMREDAETQWTSGCIRLEAYVEDGATRLAEEQALRQSDAVRADATGRMERQRASSNEVGLDGGLLKGNSDLNARLQGLDPQSPYVTQRPQQGFFWYKTGEGEIERRDPGLPLVEVDPTLSCYKFRSTDWLQQNRPEWPPNLRAATAKYAEDVRQQVVVMPPKGSQPSKGELVF